MNHSGSGHLKGMVLLMGGLFIAMRVFGVSTGDALVYAAVLACPLMMVMMMFGGHGGHGDPRTSQEAPPLDDVLPHSAGDHTDRGHRH
ncbi:Protein of unknown function [Georgenia satyanarayanai]|uniref:DUF2933 domain-containing protein n=1 Tax=Georgenia satyanarayanai TaxID=860221 RepID=A0A2Y9ASY3_9MICO|nr:DUF2933 domain-containing protein [Georgenia satyanarayanai]PYF95982.1 Protein of unknown function (DUF2933) [Georgenia satyanarayanai]SSA47176.1 Protein of unknown function [Georgenia satyanarayanai]